MEIKTCSTCQIQKPLSEFGNNKSKKDGKQCYCKDCGRVNDRKHYANNSSRKEKITVARQNAKLRNKEFVINYLLTHPCVDCGETDPFFLEFDHKESKLLEVGSMVTWAWSIEKIIQEINKCEVRCVKCHKIQTAKRAGWYQDYLSLVAKVQNEKEN
jgi:hypothetical protein